MLFDKLTRVDDTIVQLVTDIGRRRGSSSNPSVFESIDKGTVAIAYQGLLLTRVVHFFSLKCQSSILLGLFGVSGTQPLSEEWDTLWSQYDLRVRNPKLLVPNLPPGTGTCSSRLRYAEGSPTPSRNGLSVLDSVALFS
jgi:hypothetical protein